MYGEENIISAVIQVDDNDLCRWPSGGIYRLVLFFTEGEVAENKK